MVSPPSSREVTVFCLVLVLCIAGTICNSFLLPWSKITRRLGALNTFTVLVTYLGPFSSNAPVYCILFISLYFLNTLLNTRTRICIPLLSKYSPEHTHLYLYPSSFQIPKNASQLESRMGLLFTTATLWVSWCGGMSGTAHLRKALG